MISYTTRRKRWWKKLKNFDSTAQVSDGILAEYLLDSAGLDKTQKLMILTSTQNKMEYNLIEEALKDQHPTIQDEESRGRRSDRKSDERK